MSISYPIQCSKKETLSKGRLIIYITVAPSEAFFRIEILSIARGPKKFWIFIILGKFWTSFGVEFFLCCPLQYKMDTLLMVSVPHPSNSSGVYKVGPILVCVLKAGKPIIAMERTTSSQYPSLTKQSDPEQYRMMAFWKHWTWTRVFGLDWTQVHYLNTKKTDFGFVCF